MKFYRLSAIIWTLWSCATFAQERNGSENASTLSKIDRVALFEKVVADIERLDGDGLTIREQRPEQWKATIARLRAAASDAKTAEAFGQVFHKLRATYPNLHANVSLASGYNEKWMPGGVVLPFAMRADVLSPDNRRPVMRIATVDQFWAKVQPDTVIQPELGDVVLSINRRPIEDWLRENEIFCRYPLPGQCPVEFQRNLARGFLFWQPGMPMNMTLRRGEKTLEAELNLPSSNPPPPATSQSSAPIGKSDPPPCDAARPRMPDGYTLVWAGTMVCVFENDLEPGVQIWRIESFASEESRTFNPTPGQHKSVNQETDTFYNEFWKLSASKIKHLVIDVAGNSGGEVVIRWLQLLAPQPFAMPFGEYKKIREIDLPTVRKALFWGSLDSQRFIDQLKRDGTFGKLPENGWLPAQQKFCFSEGVTGESCNEVRHSPRPHGFKGQLTIVLDQYCHSACVTFSLVARTTLKARIVGLPDTGDTTFSRLQLHFGFDATGAPITSVEDPSAVSKPVGRFTIAATRTVDEKGIGISAKPLMPDLVVQRGWQQSGDEWARAANIAALRKL